MSSKKPTAKKTAAKKAPAEKTAKAADPKKVTKIDLSKFPKPTNRYLKSISAPLTPTEKDARSKESAKVWKQIEQLEYAKKQYAEEKNSEIKKLDARFSILMNIADTGREDREVKVCSVPDERSNQMLTVVEATGDVIERRTLTAEEKIALQPKKPGTVHKLGLVTDAPADAGKGTHTEADKERATKKDGKMAAAADDTENDDEDGTRAHSKRGTHEDLEPEGGPI